MYCGWSYRTPWVSTTLSWMVNMAVHVTFCYQYCRTPRGVCLTPHLAPRLLPLKGQQLWQLWHHIWLLKSHSPYHLQLQELPRLVVFIECKHLVILRGLQLWQPCPQSWAPQPPLPLQITVTSAFHTLLCLPLFWTDLWHTADLEFKELFYWRHLHSDHWVQFILSICLFKLILHVVPTSEQLLPLTAEPYRSIELEFSLIMWTPFPAEDDWITVPSPVSKVDALGDSDTLFESTSSKSEDGGEENEEISEVFGYERLKASSTDPAPKINLKRREVNCCTCCSAVVCCPRKVVHKTLF